VEIEVHGDRLIIRAVPRLRLGWDEVFAAMAEQHNDVLLNHINITDWDRVRARASKINKNKWTKV
jgi:antitoxin MazE